MSDRLENNKVAARYAKALFESALAAGEADAVARDLESLNEVFGQVPDLYAFMENPGVPDDEKSRLVEKQFGKAVGPWVGRLLQLLLENKRFGIFPQLVAQYIDLLNRHENVARAEVVTAVELEAELRDRIRKTLESTFGYKQVDLQQRVDPGILGGMILKIGDQVVDGSYIGRLEDLRKQVGKV